MKFTQHLITYHGCSVCYLDGTNEIVYGKCQKATFNQFWKNAEHVKNRIAKSTRSQVKRKPNATYSYIKSYFNCLKFVKNKGTQSDPITLIQILIIFLIQTQKQTLIKITVKTIRKLN